MYAPVGDVEAWAEVVVKVLTDPDVAGPRSDRLAWTAHAETIAAACYQLMESDACAASPV
jgi:hypothetical protein